jgi:hypothetical protein
MSSKSTSTIRISVIRAVETSGTMENVTGIPMVAVTQLGCRLSELSSSGRLIGRSGRKAWLWTGIPTAPSSRRIGDAARAQDGSVVARATSSGGPIRVA